MFDEVRTHMDREKHIQILSHSIQSFRSLFCGWYATAFCLSVGINLMSPRQFVKIYVKKPKSKNDEIVTHFIKEIENKC